MLKNLHYSLHQEIQQHIVIIGACAVRSYTKYPIKSVRYTLDIDAVATPENIKTVHAILIKKDFVSSEERDRGVLFF
ncbi:MAG: hypothetical protein KAR64_04040 [Thermoplasmatales archaeon]|nr:hypothetical protein [Thermoplasmatales archaeon]